MMFEKLGGTNAGSMPPAVYITMLILMVIVKGCKGCYNAGTSGFLGKRGDGSPASEIDSKGVFHNLLGGYSFEV